MTQGHLIDTNVIIRYPSALQNFEKPIIHLKTIEEIDRLKDSENFELGYRARKGAKYIEHYLQNIIIENKNYRKKIVDDILLECAKKNNYVLVTNDLTLRLKCKFNNVQTAPYRNGDSSIYTGVRTYLLKNKEEVDTVLETIEDVKENEFIIFKDFHKTIEKPNGDLDHDSIEELVCKNGELFSVPETTFSNYFYRKVKARNPEQKCLMYALSDPEITVICASGTYGTG